MDVYTPKYSSCRPINNKTLAYADRCFCVQTEAGFCETFDLSRELYIFTVIVCSFAIQITISVTIHTNNNIPFVILSALFSDVAYPMS